MAGKFILTVTVLDVHKIITAFIGLHGSPRVRKEEFPHRHTFFMI